jgi:hypothetical protein
LCGHHGLPGNQTSICLGGSSLRPICRTYLAVMRASPEQRKPFAVVLDHCLVSWPCRLHLSNWLNR